MKKFFHILFINVLIAICLIGLSSSSLMQPVSIAAGGSDLSNENESSETAITKQTESATSDCVTPVTMYYQTDPAYKDYLYGGQDRMASYGCGPTALAIAISSLSDQAVTPVDAAIWAADHGYYSPHSGSVHTLIPDGARSFGLQVEHLTPLTPDTMRLCLSSSKLIVLLMGPGDFSDSGHFIVAYGYDSAGNIYVADPSSPERSGITWSADLLISQLSQNAQDSGPVWVLSK